MRTKYDTSATLGTPEDLWRGEIMRASRASVHQTIARVAAQLGRQPKAYALLPDEVAADAIAMVRHARAARRSLERQERADGHLTAAKKIASRYDALVADPDINGAVIALKFLAGTYSSGFRNLFVVV